MTTAWKDLCGWLRLTLAGGAVLVAMLACSPARSEPDVDASSTAPEPITTTSPIPTVDSAAEEKAVTALFEDYWEALVTVNNDLSADTNSTFDGIIPAELVEGVMAGVNSNASNGLHRVGEPEISGVTVIVDGDTATVEACIDQRPWQFVQGDAEPFTVATTITPQGVVMAKSDGSWLITDFIEEADASISC